MEALTTAKAAATTHPHPVNDRPYHGGGTGSSGDDRRPDYTQKSGGRADQQDPPPHDTGTTSKSGSPVAGNSPPASPITTACANVNVTPHDPNTPKDSRSYAYTRPSALQPPTPTDFKPTLQLPTKVIQWKKQATSLETCRTSRKVSREDRIREEVPLGKDHNRVVIYAGEGFPFLAIPAGDGAPFSWRRVSNKNASPP